MARRFFTKIDFSFECWTWNRGQVHGYGQFQFAPDGKGPKRAHRICWYLLMGEWPVEHLDHLCKSRLCVNPWHLEEVSLVENTRRGWAWEAVRLSNLRRYGSRKENRGRAAKTGPLEPMAA